MTSGSHFDASATNERSPADQTLTPRETSRWGSCDAVPLMLILLVVTAGYFVRMTVAPLRGEETRRGLFSRTMLQTGEWMVPKQQGAPLIDRPPGFYWINAGVFRLMGRHDVLALRMSTVVATLLTSLMVYAYARRFASPAAAFTGGVAYATMGMVLDMGRRAETEGVFTFFFAASLLAWHYCFASRRRPVVTWSVGYVICAIAALVKGTQAPVCFGGTVVLFLVLRRDWRYLFAWSHLFGIGIFCAVVGAWQVPFYFAAGWEGVHLSWFGPTTQRLHASFGKFVAHLFTFPVEVMIGMLPWSIFLLALLSRRFRATLGPAGPAAAFVGVVLLVTFFPTWVVPDARGRYFMPGYPLAALLVAVVAQRCLDAVAVAEPGPINFWRGTTRAVAIVFAAGIVVVVVSTIVARFSTADWVGRIAQPTSFAIFYALAGAACVAGMLRSATRLSPRNLLRAGAALAGLVVLTYNGAVLNAMLRAGVDVQGEVRAVESRMPPGTRLVSLGMVQHKFAFCVDYPIRRIDRPTSTYDMDPSVTYFCFNEVRKSPATLPFAWESLASINMDRTAKADPNIRVVVGRRLPDSGWTGPTAVPSRAP